MATATKFRKIKSVTLPPLKLNKGEPRFIFVLGPIFTGKSMDPQKGPPDLLHAVDMETGEEGMVMCPAVMVKELRENYPGDSYVRKGFEVVVTKVPDKRYNMVSISEVAPPDDFTPPPGSDAPRVGLMAGSNAGRKPGGDDDDDDDDTVKGGDTPPPESAPASAPAAAKTPAKGKR